MAYNHPTHPAAKNEGGNYCNALLWNCKGPECDYHYENAEAVVCPICNTPRTRCKAHPINGRESCKFHGGKALMGIHHPTYKGGSLSKHLPTRLLDSFFEALDHPDVLNGTDDIALLETRRNELLGRLDQNLPPAAGWAKIAELFQTYRKKEQLALTTQSRPLAQRYMGEAQKALGEAEDLIIQGYYADQTWVEIGKIQEQKRKLTETEQRRRKEAEQVISPEQFKTLLVHIIKIIRDETVDKQALRRIEDRLMALRLGNMAWQLL